MANKPGNLVRFSRFMESGCALQRAPERPSLGSRKRQPMIRKLVFWLVLVPLAIVILMFAVANREVVTVSFDPFSSHQPAASVRVPLFVLIFILVILGVIIGGVASWLRQGKHRRAA